MTERGEGMFMKLNLSKRKYGKAAMGHPKFGLETSVAKSEFYMGIKGNLI
jgi:hypothetical protein